MAAVSEVQRIDELRRLGLSESLIKLSSGELLHEVFRFTCIGPPYYAYHGAWIPNGPPLVPLWDHNDWVLAVWKQPDGLEFLRYCIEDSTDFRRVARTEQGFWLTQFDFLYECEITTRELGEAAAAVGYRFLDHYIAAREAAKARLGTFSGHDSWLRTLVADIDRETEVTNQRRG
jgi:hypothetical protein